MRLRHVLTAAVMGVGITSVAHASLSVGIVEIPLNSGASTDDSTLGQIGASTFARSFEVDVDQEGGEKWTFGTMKVDLSTNGGAFYNPDETSGKVDSAVEENAIENTAGTRYLYNDTYVTTPDGGSSVVFLGKSDYPTNQTGNGSFPGDTTGFARVSSSGAGSSATLMDVAWGELGGDTQPDGIYAIARFTIIGYTASPTTIVGHVGGTQHNFTDVPFSYNVPAPFDFNMDGSSDNGDFAAYLEIQNNFEAYSAQYFGGDDTAAANYALAAGDFNGDGSIDNGDITAYLNLLNGIGSSIPDAKALAAEFGSVVPEPTTLSLLCLPAVAMIRRRRK